MRVVLHVLCSVLEARLFECCVVARQSICDIARCGANEVPHLHQLRHPIRLIPLGLGRHAAIRSDGSCEGAVRAFQRCRHAESPHRQQREITLPNRKRLVVIALCLGRLVVEPEQGERTFEPALFGPPFGRQRAREERIELSTSAQHVIAHVANEQEQLLGSGRPLLLPRLPAGNPLPLAPLFDLRQLRMAHIYDVASNRISATSPRDQAETSQQHCSPVVLASSVQHCLFEHSLFERGCGCIGLLHLLA